MSSENNYGYGEEPEKPSRAELAARSKKQLEPPFGEGWRNYTNFDTNDAFSLLRAARKIQQQQQREVIRIPDSLKDITIEQAKERGLDEPERMRRNRDFAIKRKSYLDNKRSLQ